MNTNANDMRPIGVLDSGVGGISVLRELVKIMPGENFLYFGDSYHAPYGTKTIEEVRRLTMEHAGALLKRGAKGIVVACNTATSAAVRVMRETYPTVPIVGIEPAVKPAVMSMEHPRVLVMATPMTIHEQKLKRLIETYGERGEIIPLACPGLMNFVERGDLDGEDLQHYLKDLLYEYTKYPVDAVVLGCTHYPFVRDMIQSVLGDSVAIFDGGEGTAREMKRRLLEAGLLVDSQEGGYVEFDNSLPEPERQEKIALCELLLHKK